jgi:hypothetical protein
VKSKRKTSINENQILPRRNTNIITDPASRGLVEDKYSDMLFVHPDEDNFTFAEEITGAAVYSTACDGRRPTRRFKSLKGAAKHMKEEQYFNDGGVSNDGIVRFDDVRFQLGGSGSYISRADDAISVLRKLA